MTFIHNEINSNKKLERDGMLSRSKKSEKITIKENDGI